MKHLILPLFIIFLFSTELFAQISPDESDFQIWNDNSISIPLKKSTDRNGKAFERMAVSVNGVLRLGQNVSRPIDERIGLGFNYRLNKNISFAPDFIYRVNQPTKNRNFYESRIRFAVVLENKWKKFSLNDRNQIEYRLRNSRNDSVRYKNRLRLNVPVTKNQKEIFTPFVSTEPHYDFQAKRWIRHEFFVGINEKFNKNFAADFFYMFINDRNLPNIINGIGVSLKFKIDRK